MPDSRHKPGRCPRCRQFCKRLHVVSHVASEEWLCDDCDPSDGLRTLRRSRADPKVFGRVPCGGGYRILRRPFRGG